MIFPLKSAFDCNEKEYEEIREKYAQLEVQHPIRELSNDEVNNMLNQVSSKVADFETYITSGQFKL